jgi:undecaprenyl-diphosphatase
MLAVLEQLDHRLFFLLNHNLGLPWLDALCRWVSIVGDGVPLTFLVGLGLWYYDRQVFKQHYLWLLLGVVISSVLAQALKHSLDRPRPLGAFAASLTAGQVYVHSIGKALYHHSFPSGHAQSAAAVLSYLAYVYPRYSFCWGVGLCCIGWSRVYLGVHFPFDVLAGILLGIISTMSVVSLRHQR